MLVSAPASSANLGAGFDSLALAVDMGLHLGTSPFDTPRGRSQAAPETHPAAVAYREAGGLGELWWSSSIPPGRGLGFSGASRVAGAYLGSRENGIAHDDARSAAFHTAATMEGHPENAAASAFGGLVVSCETDAVALEVPAELVMALWWPSTSTSTDASRVHLPDVVPFADAVFNVSRSALFVAAISTRRLDLLATATQDRIHQAGRLRSSSESADVLDLFLAGGALAAWLSGSGPTIAALFERSSLSGSGQASGAAGERLSDALGGRPVTIADLDTVGVRESTDGLLVEVPAVP